MILRNDLQPVVSPSPTNQLRERFFLTKHVKKKHYVTKNFFFVLVLAQRCGIIFIISCFGLALSKIHTTTPANTLEWHRHPDAARRWPTAYINRESGAQRSSHRVHGQANFCSFLEPPPLAGDS